MVKTESNLTRVHSNEASFIHSIYVHFLTTQWLHSFETFAIWLQLTFVRPFNIFNIPLYIINVKCLIKSCTRNIELVFLNALEQVAVFLLYWYTHVDIFLLVAIYILFRTENIYNFRSERKIPLRNKIFLFGLPSPIIYLCHLSVYQFVASAY